MITLKNDNIARRAFHNTCTRIDRRLMTLVLLKYLKKTVTVFNPVSIRSKWKYHATCA